MAANKAWFYTLQFSTKPSPVDSSCQPEKISQMPVLLLLIVLSHVHKNNKK